MSSFLRDNIRSIALNTPVGYLSEEDLDFICQHFETFQLDKGDFWLREGQHCRYYAVLEQGVLVYFHYVEGEETARDFALEGDWASEVYSIHQNQPAKVNIKALEPCILHALSLQSLNQLLLRYPHFLLFRAHLIEKSFADVVEYNANLNGLDAETHYKKLMDTRPLWLQRIPQYYIASFMGIKPQSLSRIRKKMSEE